MKKIKPFLALLILGLTLTGCNDNTSSNSSTTSSETSTSTSTSSNAEQFATLEQALKSIKTNYQFESTIKLTSGSNTSKYICEVSLGDNSYKATNYADVDSAGKTPTKDSIDSIGYYAKGEKNDFAYNVYLGLDNVVHYQALTSSSTGKALKWANTDYTNPFSELTVDDFSKVSAGYKLKTTTATQKAALAQIGVNLSGGLPIEAKSILITNENNVIGVTINYVDASTTSGYTVGVTLQGTFTKFGNDLVSLPTSLTKSDATFDNAMKLLQSGNFQFDSTRTADMTFKDALIAREKYTYTGKSNSKDFVMSSYYQLFNTNTNEYGDKLGESSTGIKQVEVDGDIGVVQVSQFHDASENTDYYYYDGAIQGGYTLTENFLPEYSLSSAFFKKDETNSTATKAVYKFDTDIYVEKVNSKNYSPIELSMDFDGFSVTIDTSDANNTVISFTNTYETTYPYATTDGYVYIPLEIVDVVTYSNIGKIEGEVFAQEIKSDCSNLVWTDSWNSVCSYATEEGSIAQPSDVFGIEGKDLDEYVPMLGGIYPSYEINAYNSQYWLTYSTTSTSELSSMFATYIKSLEDKGFTTSSTTDDNSLIYTKVISDGGVSKTLQIEVTILQGSSTYYLAISPSYAA